MPLAISCNNYMPFLKKWWDSHETDLLKKQLELKLHQNLLPLILYAIMIIAILEQIFWLTSERARRNMESTSHLQLIQYITHCNWKEKINFFTVLSEQINEQRLQLLPKILQASWAELLNQTSINILAKAVHCLSIFTKAYGLHSIKVKREIMHKLLELTRMKRKQIDENIVEIICTLIVKEKDTSQHVQRFFLSSCFENFRSFDHPTFLFGANQDDAMEEEDTQMHIIEDQLDPQDSFSLEYLLEALKGCRKQVLNLIVSVASRLVQTNVLSEREQRSLSQGIENVKDVIVNRRCVESTEKAEIESKISQILRKLTSTS